MSRCLIFLCLILWSTFARADFIPKTEDAKAYVSFCTQTRNKIAKDWGIKKPWPKISLYITKLDSGPHKGGSATASWIKAEGTHEDLQNILLPHEILHTLFRSHFRTWYGQRYLPPYLEEGSAVQVESVPRAKGQSFSIQELKSTTSRQLKSWPVEKQRAFYTASGTYVLELLRADPDLLPIKVIEKAWSKAQ